MFRDARFDVLEVSNQLKVNRVKANDLEVNTLKLNCKEIVANVGMTASTIKNLYENQYNTNAFTDDEKKFIQKLRFGKNDNKLHVVDARDVSNDLTTENAVLCSDGNMLCMKYKGKVYELPEKIEEVETDPLVIQLNKIPRNSKHLKSLFNKLDVFLNFPTLHNFKQSAEPYDLYQLNQRIQTFLGILEDN